MFKNTTIWGERGEGVNIGKQCHLCHFFCDHDPHAESPQTLHF